MGTTQIIAIVVFVVVMVAIVTEKNRVDFERSKPW